MLRRGSLYLWQQLIGQPWPLLPLLHHASSSQRDRDTHRSSVPQDHPFPLHLKQHQARTGAPATGSSYFGRGTCSGGPRLSGRGWHGYQSVGNALLRRPASRPAGAAGRHLRWGITTTTSGGHAAAQRPALPGAERQEEQQLLRQGQPFPSLPPAQPPPPSRSSIANPQAAPTAS